MSGFKNESNNIVFEQNLFSLIILHISRCCEKMRDDCKATGENLCNHEDKISNRLVERYLNADIKGLRFILQKPEHFDTCTDTYKGRTDITVVSSDWLYTNSEAYYIIESKRLDGKSSMNKKYISEGISRFVMPLLPKYSSYYGKNIMLGYIVQAINVSENTQEIDKLQRKLLTDVTIGEMKCVNNDNKGFMQYKCLYQAGNQLEIELAHLFYDFSDVMQPHTRFIGRLSQESFDEISLALLDTQGVDANEW